MIPDFSGMAVWKMPSGSWRLNEASGNVSKKVSLSWKHSFSITSDTCTYCTTIIVTRFLPPSFTPSSDQSLKPYEISFWFIFNLIFCVYFLFSSKKNLIGFEFDILLIALSFNSPPNTHTSTMLLHNWTLKRFWTVARKKIKINTKK